jgi:hypothetical protein
MENKKLSTLSKAITLPPDVPDTWWTAFKRQFHVPSIVLEKFETVDDYFNLPESEILYKNIWYRTPAWFPWNTKDGYIFDEGSLANQWKKEIRKRYPVQWFFREWLFSHDNPLYSFVYTKIYRVRVWWMDFRAWVHPWQQRTVKASRPFGYSDASALVSSVNLAILLDFFYEDYKVNTFVDWKADEHHRTFEEELHAQVEIVEKEIPMLEQKARELLSNSRYEEVTAVEEQIDQKTTDVIVWIAKNRHMMWT